MYNYTDHLGNIRLRYTSTGLGNGIQKLEENHYYPFGLKHKKYNSYQYVFVALNEIDGYDLGIDPLPESERDEYQYKYNGKEWQDELSLNLYDYGARNYDAALGRWMNIDPLAEQYRRWTPYNYVMNNPMIFTDPDGMRASPIYGTSGQFLGTDSEGFQGEILFMQESTFIIMGGQGMNHNLAMEVGSTLDDVIGDNPAKTFSNSEANMVNNAITDVVSRTEGLSSSFITGIGTPTSGELHNGKTSSSYYRMGTLDGTPAVWNQANDGVNLGSAAMARQDDVSEGKSKVTYNLAEYKGGEFTVANLQNTFVHEFGGHFKAGIQGGSNSVHAEAIKMQKQHSSWKHTTKEFQRRMNDIFKEYTRK